MVASAVGISRKNIYRHRLLPRKDKQLVEDINQAHILNPAYGQYKMALHLGINHKRAERVMKLYGIKAPRRKAKKHFCTVSVFNHHYTNLIADILPEQFTPHLIWVCDVCKTKAGYFHVLEIGSFSCCGLYECDTDIIVEKVSAKAWTEFQEFRSYG